MSVFDDVKQSLSIRDVVEFYGFKINRAGQFTCPFHNDHKPSASIKNDYFNCFVCGTGGDIITFTAKLHGISNYEACKKLASDFGLMIATEPQNPLDKLRADRERAKRQAERKQQEEEEALIQHTGNVLADYHRYLWQGLQFQQYGHIAHMRALQWIDYARYANDLYMENPREFTLNNREQVRQIEQQLHKWNNENK